MSKQSIAIIPAVPVSTKGRATGFFQKIGEALGVAREGPGAAIVGLAVFLVVVGLGFYFLVRGRK